MLVAILVGRPIGELAEFTTSDGAGFDTGLTAAAAAAAASSALRDFRIPRPMVTMKNTYDAAASHAIPYAMRVLSDGNQLIDCAVLGRAGAAIDRDCGLAMDDAPDRLLGAMIGVGGIPRRGADATAEIALRAGGGVRSEVAIRGTDAVVPAARAAGAIITWSSRITPKDNPQHSTAQRAISG